MRRESESLKAMRGTARADRRRPGMRGAAGVGRMPAGMANNKPAARAWRLIAAELGDRLRPVDGLALHLLALHYGAAIDAAEALIEAGPVSTDAAHVGIKKNPAAVVMAQHSDRAARLLVEFGATPRSRSAFFAGDEDQDRPSLVDLLFADIEAGD